MACAVESGRGGGGAASAAGGQSTAASDGATQASPGGEMDGSVRRPVGRANAPTGGFRRRFDSAPALGQSSGGAARRPGEMTMLVVFSGAPKVGDLGQAAREMGVTVKTVDILEGGHEQDVLRESVFSTLAEGVAAGAYDVVWLAPPCSTFSVLHLRRAARPYRTREEPSVVSGLSSVRQARVREHNELAS